MNRSALAWAVALLVVACSSSKVVERSAPERPAWVEQAPAARGELYFVGTCTDLPSYQEALACARVEAYVDVTAWVGGRFSSYVYSASTETARSGGTAAYFDSQLFLQDLRRSETYYEVRQEDWGRAYLVSVLISYPRHEGEAERARIERTTRRAEKLVDEAPGRIAPLAAAGRWGEAMDSLLGVAGQVAVPRNLQRERDSARLAALAEDLITPLRLSAERADSGIEVAATYRNAPAAGVPLECVVGRSRTTAVTGSDGRAVCSVGALPAGESGRVSVRPAVSGYLAAVPTLASGLAVALGGLLDEAVTVDVGAPLDIAVALAGGRGCEAAMEVLGRRLQAAGARVNVEAESLARLEVSCEVEDPVAAGDLYRATVRGALMIEIAGGISSESRVTVRGVGARPGAARREALSRLGEELSAAALELLRVVAGTEEP